MNYATTPRAPADQAAARLVHGTGRVPVGIVAATDIVRVHSLASGAELCKVTAQILNRVQLDGAVRDMRVDASCGAAGGREFRGSAGACGTSKIRMDLSKAVLLSSSSFLACRYLWHKSTLVTCHR